MEEPAGWVFFDADCLFCVAARRRWGPIFERRGFVWLPMQIPGSADRLGVTPGQMVSAMWLLPAGAHAVSGVEAWIGLMRHVWWLAPLAWMLAAPGIRRVAKAGYRWIARHRHCLAGQCRIVRRGPSEPRRHTAFFDLP